jgi:Protein of unknown function (DUF402)
VRWRPGDAIVLREVWHGRPYGVWGGIVVQDDPELVALYMPESSPMTFDDDFFGAPHPWHGKDEWHGHGVLQLHRPGGRHAVWVFWDGPDRVHTAWYVNLQDPLRRTAIGFDTQDHELDLVVRPDLTWYVKDDERMEGWIERGRWTADEVAEIRADGARVAAELEAGRRWWSDEWATWTPDPAWSLPELPTDWRAAETAT